MVQLRPLLRHVRVAVQRVPVEEEAEEEADGGGKGKGDAEREREEKEDPVVRCAGVGGQEMCAHPSAGREGCKYMHDAGGLMNHWNRTTTSPRYTGFEKVRNEQTFDSAC
jgi:hypothetical protein